MKTTHTPAPWKITHAMNYVLIGADKSDPEIDPAICTIDKSHRLPETNEANIALIVNAPELLAALIEITETFRSYLGCSDPLYLEDFKEEIAQAEDAIKKATE